MMNKRLYHIAAIIVFAVSLLGPQAYAKTAAKRDKQFSLPKTDLTISGSENFSTSVHLLQDRILSLAKKYASMNFVPYIWGGSKVGSVETCESCRECVAKSKAPLFSRLNACAPCRECGIDCSHFVHHLFREAGLSYPYASSREFGRQSRTGLLDIYGFVDIGTDLASAQPGDVLVFPRHVAVLMKVIDSQHGDIVHATRFRDGDFLRLGGFRYEINQNLRVYRGRLQRVLRHFQLFENRKQFSHATAQASDNFS